jgi:hypothetical protein
MTDEDILKDREVTRLHVRDRRTVDGKVISIPDRPLAAGLMLDNDTGREFVRMNEMSTDQLKIVKAEAKRVIGQKYLSLRSLGCRKAELKKLFDEALSIGEKKHQLSSKKN